MTASSIRGPETPSTHEGRAPWRTPDGRALHRYRPSDETWEVLTRTLRRDLLTGRRATVASEFAIWSAERYRRDYDGGPLSWEFLTDPLGASLAQDEWRHLTAQGLNALRRPIGRSEAAVQYLRTLAAEGGIPIRLLGGDGAYRSALAGIVAELARLGLACPRDTLLGIVARRTRRFPAGYRTAEYQSLFAEFAVELLELRLSLPREVAESGIEAHLDCARPGWRDGLALRLDGEAARALLLEAATAKDGNAVGGVPIGRVLHRTEDGWAGRIEVADRGHVAPALLSATAADRRRIQLGPVGDLAVAAPSLVLTLERETLQDAWTARRIGGHRSRAFAYPLERAADLAASADGALMGRVRLPGLGAMDPAEGPTFWRLAETDAEGAPAALSHAGNASLRTRDRAVWMTAAAECDPECGDGLEMEREGEVEGASLWRLSGRGRVLTSGGNAFIETDAASEGRDEVHPSGPLEYRVLDAKNAPVHRGPPAIVGGRAGRDLGRIPKNGLLHRMGRSGPWHPGAPPPDAIGRAEVALREASGNVGARTGFAVLPEEFSVRDVAGPGEARLLRFEGVPDGCALKVGEGDACTPDANGVVDCAVPGGQGGRGRLPLVVVPPGGRPLDWRIDLPCPFGEWQSLDGRVSDRDAEIGMAQLAEWRAVPADVHDTQLRVRLHGARISAVIWRDVPAELPLSAFRPLLEEALSVAGADGELRLRLVAGGRESGRLKVRQALGETRLEEDGVHVIEDRVPVFDPNLGLTAVDMDDPARIASCGPGSLEALGEGRWFLLPRREGAAMRPPRPFVRPEPASATGANARSRSDRVGHYSMELRAASDEELRRLAALCGVLREHGVSPSTLDEVHALVRAPEAAIRMLTLVDTSDLDDVLSLELHKGPHWRSLAPRVWAAAFGSLRRSVIDRLIKIPLPGEEAERHARSALMGRVREIAVLRPELFGHLALALQRIDPAAFTEMISGSAGPTLGLPRPERTLIAHANRMARRHGHKAAPPRGLAALGSPNGFDRFDPAMRGLIDAPLVTAEIAHGRRPWPDGPELTLLAEARLFDPGAFEEALPAAMAWFETLDAKGKHA